MEIVFLLAIPLFLPIMMQQDGLFKGTVYNFMNRAFLMLSAFILNIYASRFLGTDEFGHAQFINWTAAFTWMIFNMGIPSILSRFVPGASGKERFGQLLRHTLMLLMLALVLAFTTAIFITGIRDEYLWASLFLILMHMLNYFVVAWMQSFLLYRKVFMAQSLAAACSLLSGVVMIPMYGLKAFVFCLVLLHTLGFVFLVFPWIKMMLYKWQTRSGEGLSARLPMSSLYRTTVYLALSAMLSSVLWQRSEFYFIKEKLSNTDIALYAVAFSLIALATEPFRMLTGTLTNYFAQRFNLKESSDDMFTKLYKQLWLVTVFSCVFLWYYAQQVVLIFYHPLYKEAAVLVQLLLPGVFLGVCSYVVMSYQVAAGRARFLFIQDFLSAALLIGLVMFLVDSNGIKGVAVSRSIALSFSVITGLIYSVWRLKLKFPFNFMLFSLGLSVTINFASTFLHPQDWPFLLGVGATSFLLYFFILKLTGVISTNEMEELFTKVKGFLGWK